MTPEQQQELHELRAALESEFRESETSRTIKEAKNDLIDLKPDMLDALEHTLKHGTTEQRSKVAMWGYGKLLEESKASTDAIHALIEGMPAPAPSSSPKEDDDVGTTSPEAEAKARDIPRSILESVDDTE